MTIERVGVAGAGTMGSGIAQLACLGRHETFLHDPDAAALAAGEERVRAGLLKGADRGRWTREEAEAASARLVAAPRLEDLSGCDLVIEAAPESLGLKREVFDRLAAACGPETVLATNTSSLSVTAIAAEVERPERVCGMHFFNPPVLMRLVEVVPGTETDAEVAGAVTALAERMGRTPVRAADEIGFIANRCARPYSLEGLRLLGDRVATVEQIDSICRLGGGFRMGPFELTDLVGVDVNFEVAKSFWEQSFHEPRWQPSPIQAKMVAAGRLGRKSGRGYYDYAAGPHRADDPEHDPPPANVSEWSGSEAVGLDPATQVAALERIVCQLVNEAAFALGRGIGSAADIDTAMRLGFNYPRGPLAWGDAIGAEGVLSVLDRLRSETGEERYRSAPLLRRRAAEGRRLAADA
ncbi:MAG TPA: 3-hydroxyacyl-CoA dehydrogenase NAD-binding domain-containing protein [Solirubrobacterales bacterium]